MIVDVHVVGERRQTIHTAIHLTEVGDGTPSVYIFCCCRPSLLQICRFCGGRRLSIGSNSRRVGFVSVWYQDAFNAPEASPSLAWSYSAYADQDASLSSVGVSG